LTPPLQPERGFNTMAAALEQAAESSPVIKQHMDKNKAKILADTRAWLHTLVATGNNGSYALEKLKDMARRGDVTDEWLAAFIWPGSAMNRTPAPSAVAAPAQEKVSEQEADGKAVESVERFIPDRTRQKLSPSARRAKMLSDVRAWVTAVAEGKHASIGALTDQFSGGHRYAIIYRFRDAGMLKSNDAPISKDRRFIPIHPAIDRIYTMSDEELAGFIWLSARTGADGLTDPQRARNQLLSETPDDADNEPDDTREEEAPPGLTAPAGSPAETLDLIASRIGDIVTVLMRFDARFTRLERELGLPPIEQEMAKKQSGTP
jgi:hypothetical protein